MTQFHSINENVQFLNDILWYFYECSDYIYDKAAAKTSHMHLLNWQMLCISKLIYATTTILNCSGDEAVEIQRTDWLLPIEEEKPTIVRLVFGYRMDSSKLVSDCCQAAIWQWQSIQTAMLYTKTKISLTVH